MKETQHSLAPAAGIIALDYGRRRVGVAACAELPITFGVATLTIASIGDLLGQLEPILAERRAKNVLIGFPLSLGDKPGPIAGDVLHLKKLLEDRGFSVHLVDEALSSRRADEILRRRGRRSRSGERDRASAALLLQDYLDGVLPPLSFEEISRWQIKPPPDKPLL